MPLKMNHSASFVVSNNCLDKCPKCGQNVCEHTSVADAINLKNSVSQDFSTYSSDSSLAKQLFNDPMSNALVNYGQINNKNNNNNNKCNRISLSAINKLNESFFINQYQKQQQYLKNFKECNCSNNNQSQKQMQQQQQPQVCFNNISDNQFNFMPCFTVRPLSCQVMIIDNETTDKLLKDFFDASSTNSHHMSCNHHHHHHHHQYTINTPTTTHRYSSIMPSTVSTNSNNNNNNNNNQVEEEEDETKPWHSSPKNEISTNNNNNSIKLVDDLNRLNKAKEKSQKKKKFSNFRLFLRNSSSINKSESSSTNTDNKSTSPIKKTILKSSGLVNCLTSSTSSSSSSCEELRHKLFKNKKSTNKTSKIAANNNNNNNNNMRQISDTTTTTTTTDNEQHTILYEEPTTDQSNSTLQFAPNEINKELQNNETKLSLCKSIMSLTNNKNMHEQEQVEEEDQNDNSDYNQMQNIDLCPIVVSDIDEYQEETTRNKQSEQNNSKHNNNSTHFTNCNNNYNSNNFNNNNIINNNNNTTNINNISTIISVPLNNYLFYNYEKRNDDQKTKSSSSKIFTNNSNNKKENGNNTDSGMESTNGLDNSNSFNTIKTSTSFSTPIHASDTKIYTTKPELIINSEKIMNSQKCYSALRTNETSNILKKNRRREPISKNRLSYFSNCSTTTCQEEDEEEEDSSTSSTFDDSTTNKTEFLSESPLDSSNTNEFDSMSSSLSSSSSSSSSHRYHSISIIFIIMGLFSVNFFQEYFVLFYYFNTEQFYWLVYSMIGMFSGQTLTLILSLLTEIDFISLSQCNNNNMNKESSQKKKKNPAVNNVFSHSSSMSSSKSCNNTAATNEQQQSSEEILKINNKETKANIYNQNLYLIFKNPFSKLFLLIPGYLPISVYIHFFKHVFNYRKSSGNQRFKSEFQLSLYLFYNGIFHSLPLAIINSCYFTSITTTYSLTSYYTDLLLLFAIPNTSTSSSSLSSTAIFVDDLNMERRNQLVLLLVSIFVSIAIGICLFTTYFELMKQMNYLTFLKLKSGIYQYTGLSMFSSSNPKFNKKNSNDIEKDDDFQHLQQQNNLGLIEILVYFCYKFCLIISRLAIIGLFWYMFREWLVIVVLVHILFSYLIICISKCGQNKKKKRNDERMLKKNIKDFNNLIVDSSSNEQVSKLEKAIFKNKRSKLSKHLTLFIICLLSCIDLFMNQLSEIYHIRKVVVYYVLYFMQNFAVLTYWLVKSIMNARIQYEKDSSTNSSTTHSTNKNFVFILKSLTTVTSSGSSSSSNLKSEIFNFTPTQYACYATLIYLFICLFTIFGLILKFLHLHILRKRYNIR